MANPALRSQVSRDGSKARGIVFMRIVVLPLSVVGLNSVDLMTRQCHCNNATSVIVTLPGNTNPNLNIQR